MRIVSRGFIGAHSLSREPNGCSLLACEREGREHAGRASPPRVRRHAGRAAAGAAHPYVWGTGGAGGVWATVGDVYRWLTALEERRVLPEEQWRLLIAPPRPPAQEAFGWHVETTPEGGTRIQKGGGSDDFASHLLYYPGERVVVIWATNNLRQRWRPLVGTCMRSTIHWRSRPT
jgi:CubicO group peptidase (beta-lactamase class C family)